MCQNINFNAVSEVSNFVDSVSVLFLTGNVTDPQDDQANECAQALLELAMSFNPAPKPPVSSNLLVFILVLRSGMNK